MTPAAIVEKLREFFRLEAGDIVAAYLYGSVARSTARVGSDVDVAVLHATTPPTTLDALPLDLEHRLRLLVGRPAQVIVLNTAPPGLVHRVLRDGVLLLDRSPTERIRFEVKARNEFFDLQPMAARYRRPPVPLP